VRQALAAMLALGIAVCAGCSQERTVVIGVDLPLTGNDGAEGLMALHGIELAAEERGADPDWPIHFDLDVRDAARNTVRNPHQDEASDVPEEPRNGVASLYAFAGDPRVVGVVGAFRLDAVRAEAPVARRLRLPVVSAGTADDRERSAPERALFALGPSPAEEGGAAATAARRLGYSRVFLEHDGSPFGREVIGAFSAAFAGGSGKITRSATDADAIFFKGPADRAALLLSPRAAAVLLTPERRSLMRHRGYAPPAVAVPYVRIERAAPDTSRVPGVVERFRQRYGEIPSGEALAGYDAMSFLGSAVQIAMAAHYPSKRLRAGTLRALRTPFYYFGSTRPASPFVGVAIHCGRRGPPWQVVDPPRQLHARLSAPSSRASCRG
jgi:ABC-type branched-subunit amino acid transport system substrate-binding protein